MPPVFGVMFVSWVTNFIWPMSMSSSSAAIIIRPVFEPCPSSTRPVLTEAVLSAWIAMKLSTSCRSGGPLLANGLSAA